MSDFKEPDLSSFDATEKEKLIARKYTRIRENVCEDLPDAHTAWLVVENQSFRVRPFAADTAVNASWTCWMLAKAIQKIKQKP